MNELTNTILNMGVWIDEDDNEGDDDNNQMAIMKMVILINTTMMMIYNRYVSLAIDTICVKTSFIFNINNL